MSLKSRKSKLERNTSETNISMQLNLDGKGHYKFQSKIPFFEHMLSHLVKHSLMDLELKLEGDIDIDCHHSVEDTAIVLGRLLYECVGDKVGMNRYGHFTLTMDEVLTTVAIDMGGRFNFTYQGPDTINSGKFGIYDAELSLEFLQKLAMEAKMNLHVLVHYGSNRHHIHESVFKALGRALRMALGRDEQMSGIIFSTKGVLD